MATFFGSREVKEHKVVTAVDNDGKEVELGEVLVEYASGEPRFEAVPRDEWESGKTDRALEAGEKAKWFVDRTMALRTRVHKVFEESNPRFAEIGKILQWVEETYRLAFKQAVELKTGVADFITDGTFEHIVKAHEDAGSKMIDEAPQIVVDILDVLRKHKVPVGEVMQGGLLMTVQKSLEAITDKGFSFIVGGDDEHRRANDIADIFVVYGQKSGEKAGEQPTPVEDGASSDKEDTGALKDSSGGGVQGGEGVPKTEPTA